MEKTENKFTVKFALSSQYSLQISELVVNQNALYALIYSIISVNLRNKQAATISSFTLLLKKVFVRSLFAHYSLIVRSKGEETAFIMNLYTDLNKIQVIREVSI